MHQGITCTTLHIDDTGDINVSNHSVLIFSIDENWNKISPTTQCDRLYVIPSLHVLLYNKKSFVYKMFTKEHFFKSARVIAVTAVYNIDVFNLCESGDLFRQPLLVYHQVLHLVVSSFINIS